MVFAFNVLERQFSNLRPENLSLRKLNQSLKQKEISALWNSSNKKLGHLFAAAYNVMVEGPLEVDWNLAFWLTKEVSEICSNLAA